MKDLKPINVRVTTTDTFGGEPNWTWKRVKYTTVRGSEHERTLITKLKKIAGLDGYRCAVDKHGDEWTITPQGGGAPCIVAFINFDVEAPEK